MISDDRWDGRRELSQAGIYESPFLSTQEDYFKKLKEKMILEQAAGAQGKGLLPEKDLQKKAIAVSPSPTAEMLSKLDQGFQDPKIETSSPSTSQQQEDNTGHSFESQSPTISFGDDKSIESTQMGQVSSTSRDYSMHLVVSSYRCVVCLQRTTLQALDFGCCCCSSSSFGWGVVGWWRVYFRSTASFKSSYHFMFSTFIWAWTRRTILLLCRREELFGWKKANKNLDLDKSLCSDDTNCTEPWINDPRIAHIPTSIMWSVYINDYTGSNIA